MFDDIVKYATLAIFWEVRYAAADGTRASLPLDSYSPYDVCLAPDHRFAQTTDLDDDGIEKFVFHAHMSCIEDDPVITRKVLRVVDGAIVPHPLDAHPIHEFEDFDEDGRLDFWLNHATLHAEDCPHFVPATAVMPLHNRGHGIFSRDDRAAREVLASLCPEPGLPDFAAMGNHLDDIVLGTVCARLHGVPANEVADALAPLCNMTDLNVQCATICTKNEAAKKHRNCLPNCVRHSACDVRACATRKQLRDLATSDIAPLLAPP